MTKLVDALWVAGFHATLPDNTQLIPHVTIARVPEPEAAASANWQIVDKTKKTQKAEE